jgi:hypothetical protein
VIVSLPPPRYLIGTSTLHDLRHRRYHRFLLYHVADPVGGRPICAKYVGKWLAFDPEAWPGYEIHACQNCVVENAIHNQEALTAGGIA